MDIENDYYLATFESIEDYAMFFLKDLGWCLDSLLGTLYKKSILKEIGEMIGIIAKRNHRVEYESLPTICFHCGTYGHMKDDYPQNHNKEPIDGANNDVQQPKASVQQLNVSVQERVEGEKFGDWMVVERRQLRLTKKSRAGKINNGKLESNKLGQESGLMGLADGSDGVPSLFNLLAYKIQMGLDHTHHIVVFVEENQSSMLTIRNEEAPDSDIVIQNLIPLSFLPPDSKKKLSNYALRLGNGRENHDQSEVDELIPVQQAIKGIIDRLKPQTKNDN
ncbi:hypothetical protein Goarm_013224 [Gossypium armourianum]|uniref:CCHC-type domain-containing protein n=1 Tax=Gossypium armourianum TaxID=34283 RepID=A0A7J9J3F3_9ROSI|nr:hypothetical protein [Gossypium armourianum]